MLKLAIVVVCFSLCGAGTFIVSTPRDEQSQQKTNLMPVKNPQLIQAELDSGLRLLDVSESSLATDLCRARVVSVDGPLNALG